MALKADQNIPRRSVRHPSKYQRMHVSKVSTVPLRYCFLEDLISVDRHEN
jgi:hypothetical protein